MLDADVRKARVVAQTQTLCPACESYRLTMDACAVGTITVHQEYVCDDCQYEFTALFARATFYAGHPEQ
jgi:transposase-like protein